MRARKLVLAPGRGSKAMIIGRTKDACSSILSLFLSFFPFFPFPPYPVRAHSSSRFLGELHGLLNEGGSEGGNES